MRTIEESEAVIEAAGMYANPSDQVGGKWDLEVCSYDDNRRLAAYFWGIPTEQEAWDLAAGFAERMTK